MNAFGILQSISSWYGLTIMGGLAALSIYMVALIIIRFGFFRKIHVNSQKMMGEVYKAVEDSDNKVLARYRDQKPSDPPVRLLVATALSNADLGQADLKDIFQVTRIRQRERLTRGLSIFGTIATISPFLGLLGTVMGIVESFQSLAQTGAAGPNVVASGVASALWTTAAGLVVAIPAVIAYNIFKGKAKTILTDMEVISQELLVLFRTNKVPKGR